MDTKSVIYIICVKPHIPPFLVVLSHKLFASHKIEKHSHKPEHLLPLASHQGSAIDFAKTYSPRRSWSAQHDKQTWLELTQVVNQWS